jgi:hypothetical protein
LQFTAADLVSAFPQLAVTIHAPCPAAIATLHIGGSEQALATAQAPGYYAKSAKDWFCDEKHRERHLRRTCLPLLPTDTSVRRRSQGGRKNWNNIHQARNRPLPKVYTPEPPHAGVGRSYCLKIY